MIECDRILENSVVRLAPIREDDFVPLKEIAYNPEIWRWTVNRIETDEELRAYIGDAVAARKKGMQFTYTICDVRTGRVAGVSALGNHSAKDRRIEIGGTWLAPDCWGGPTNRAAKSLLLTFGFEALDQERIEFKTDVLNVRARAALRKLGATEEGVLRSHTLMHDSRRRNTIYYSILRAEWAEIKAGLLG